MKPPIPLFKVFMAKEAHDAVSEILLCEDRGTGQPGFIGQGLKVDEFENRLREFFNYKYVVTTNSATSAEHLAWHYLKNQGIINNGDEVLASPLTCMATNTPITLSGFKIKWVDIDPETLNMDLEDLSKKVSRTTKAVQLVHWGGYPNDLDKVKLIQNAVHNLFNKDFTVLEDCAHAFGAKYKGEFVGTTGNISTFSLQAIKHINSIDGGFVLAPDDFINKEMRLLRWYGIDRDDKSKTDFRCEKNVRIAGSKWHMNDVNAAVGIANLKSLDHILLCHRTNSCYYDRNLKQFTGIKILKREEGFDSACWIYSMLVERKQDFMKAMEDRGVMVSQVHERNDKHSCFIEFKTHLPNLDKVIGQLVNIPVHWGVGGEEREYIIDQIKKGW